MKRTFTESEDSQPFMEIEDLELLYDDLSEGDPYTSLMREGTSRQEGDSWQEGDSRQEGTSPQKGNSPQPIPGIHTADDALIRSMNDRGRIDLPYMSGISGISVRELIRQLGGIAMWQDPEVYAACWDEKEGWLTAEQYVRGNPRRLLATAREMQEKYGRFEDNIALLESRLPDALSLAEIHVPLGATWVPAYFYSQFICELLEMPERPKVKYNDYLGKWSIDKKVRTHPIKNTFTYGTARMSAIRIIENTMNAIPVRVYDAVPRYDRDTCDYILNQEDTLAAQEKQKLILEEFARWVHGNPETEERLEQVYNEKYGYLMGQYDGSFLSLPGLNPEVQLYAHQRNAIARIVLSGNVLLAHDVGSGKTYEMIIGCHELKRMGLSSKNMIVVPNNVLDATVQAHRYLYPDDEILAVYPKHFTPAARERTLRNIREGDYAAIYLAYSSFDRITMSKGYYLDKKDQEIRRCRAALASALAPEEKRSLNNTLNRLSKEYMHILLEMKMSETACFDELGITTLVVDECHNYKNITLDSRTDNIVGLHASGSKKCNEMLEKVQYTQSIGGKIIFATGTPLTNSLADLFVLQTYLQGDELSFCRISRFSEWINTFCEQETTFEIDVDSQNFRFMTRFSRFHNLPELMAMFSAVCDFYHTDENELDLPGFSGYTDVVVKKSEEQKAYIEELAKRTELIRLHVVKRKNDNLLKVTTDGRKCALDIRLVEPLARPQENENKTSVCAGKMEEIYHAHPGRAQIAFCDCSVPQEGFNVYDELKKELMVRGIPGEEIVFIHEGTTEAKRRKLLFDLNAGKIRIMIGSTPKLGTGVNVQENLIAVHHLDIPWKPSDMVQREGRLIRQGNQNDTVFIYRYVTEGSFDAYTWQILENKQRFISSFLSGTMTKQHRAEEDIADTVLTYSEIKALAIGNPLIKQRVEVSNQLERLRIAQNQRKKQLFDLQRICQETPSEIRQRKQLIHLTEADISFYQKHKKMLSMEERAEFGKELLEALAGNVRMPKERIFDWYQEFEVVLPKHMWEEKPYVFLRRKKGGTYSVSIKGDKALGCSRRLDHVLEHLPDRRKQHEEEYKALVKKLEDVKVELEKGNPYDYEVEMTAKLLDLIDQQLKAG